MIDIPEQAIALLKELEGLRLKAYRDGAGVLTIGYGHTGEDVTARKKITEEQAEQLLIKDAQHAARTVDEMVHYPINDNQRSALICFVFNVGRTAFWRSTMLRRINARLLQEIPCEFRKWNKITVDGAKVVSDGLVNRREKEIALWLRPLN